MNEDLDKLKNIELETIISLDEIPPTELEIALSKSFNMSAKEFKKLIINSDNVNDFLDNLTCLKEEE